MKLEKPRDISLPTGVLGLASTADSARLFAACMDGQIFEVDPASGAATAFAEKHAGYDGVLMWHDVETRSVIRRVKAHDFWSWQIALSPDGGRIATASGQFLAGSEKYEPAPAAE